MLIALAFAHFSSELLLKEQMIIPVKKTLNNAGHIDAKLIDFSEICQKNPAKSAVFYWLFLGEVSPPKFPVKSADFSKNLPLKILQNLTFLHWNPRNRLICLRILTFSREYPAKSADFSANFDFFPAKIPPNRPIFPRICPWKSREIFLFFPRNIRSPVKMCVITYVFPLWSASQIKPILIYWF